MRGLQPGAFALALSIATVSPGVFYQPAQAQEDDRPEITVAFSTWPPLLEPLEPMSRVGSGWNMNYNVYDSLLDFTGDDFEIEPGLVTSWKRLDDTTFEMKIRQGVTFHDGTEMTVEDIAFSFGPERALAEDAPGRAQLTEYLPTLAGIEIIDQETIRLKTTAPSAVILQQLASFGSQVVSKDAYLAAESWEAWGRKPIGSGPYKVVEFDPDGFARMEAHDDYWGGRPPVKAINFRYVPEEAVRVAGLIAGDFDIISRFSLDQLPTIEAAEGVDVVGGETLTIRGVYFDSITNETLADPRVRRAMSHAIDRELIVETLWNGMLSIPNGWQTPAFGDMFIEDHVSARFDPDAARALLAESGYDGTPIPFRMRAGDSFPAEAANAQILVQMWRDAGINVDLQIVESWPMVWQRPGTGIRNSGDAMMYPDPLGQIWRRHCQNGWTALSGWWENEEFFANCDILESSIDLEERRAAFRRMLEIYEADPPGIVIHTNAWFFGKQSHINWQPYVTTRMDFRARNLSLD